MDEGTGITPVDSPKSLPQEINATPTRCLHHDFAAEHQFSFGWIARQLVKNDPALRDDLVQEMSLAVLEYGKPANCEYLLELAANRAMNYLKYEERRGMMPLSEAREESDSYAAKLENLRNLIQALTNRGVPVEWIDEVLGEKRGEQQNDFDAGLADAG